MALIRVNGEKENLFGAVSFDRNAIYDEDTGEVIGMNIDGLLAIHDYIDDIYEIESERYLLTDVSVYKESFGSNEFMILYYFTAKDLIVKDDIVDEDIKWLIEEDAINEEISNREWYHAYVQNEAYKEVEKLAEKYKNKDGDK